VWNEYTFTELSISLAGKTASTPYDVFLYDNSGTPALELLAWTNSTTRATALTTQDGAYVKSGATTRLYLGTIYINATGGQTDDTLAKRYLWNMYHRIEATLRRLETTDNWTYSTGTFRQANASTANQIELVAGLLEDTISLTVAAVMTENNARMGYVGVGEDSTTTPSASSIGRVGNAGEQSSANRTAVMSTFASRPSSVGYHYYAWLEAGWGTGTNTWYGDDGASVTQSGITGSWRY
jgi:hypothetical protein